MVSRVWLTSPTPSTFFYAGACGGAEALSQLSESALPVLALLFEFLAIVLGYSDTLSSELRIPRHNVVNALPLPYIAFTSIGLHGTARIRFNAIDRM